jgi:hypothetical protein
MQDKRRGTKAERLFAPYSWTLAKRQTEIEWTVRHSFFEVKLWRMGGYLKPSPELPLILARTGDSGPKIQHLPYVSVWIQVVALAATKHPQGLKGFWMHKIVQLAFLVFYLASSYAVSQERIALAVSELQHASSRNAGVQIGTCDNQNINSFPAYRQAKPKAACDAYFGPGELLHLLPHGSERSFRIQPSSLKSLSSFERVLSRAPPIAGWVSQVFVIN